MAAARQPTEEGWAAKTVRRCLTDPCCRHPPCWRSARCADLDEHQRAVAIAQDQIDLAATGGRARGHLIPRAPARVRPPAGARGRTFLAASPRCLVVVFYVDAAALVLEISHSRPIAPRFVWRRLLAAPDAAGLPALSPAGHPVRGRHADRQPRGHHARARCTCFNWSTRLPAERPRVSTQSLLRALPGIDRPGAQLLAAAPAQREREAAQAVARHAAEVNASPMSAMPARRASAIRAGAPAAAREAGYRVPAAARRRAATTLIGAAGLVAAGDPGHRLRIRGLPAEASRRARCSRWCCCWPTSRASVVLLEAPHRIEALARSLGQPGPIAS